MDVSESNNCVQERYPDVDRFELENHQVLPDLPDKIHIRYR